MIYLTDNGLCTFSRKCIFIIKTYLPSLLVHNDTPLTAIWYLQKILFLLYTHYKSNFEQNFFNE